MQVNDWNSGKVFGKIMLTGRSIVVKKKRRVFFICDCGKMGWASFSDIKAGKTQSCGCGKGFEKGNTLSRFHGFSGHRLYITYNRMKARCYTPNLDNHASYYDKGIKICDLWFNDFMEFYNWSIENGWKDKEGLSIDRIDVDGNYEPNNCRWVSAKIQSRNKTTNVYLEAFGERKCLAEWEEDPRCVVNQINLGKRFNAGWQHEKCITTPLRIKKNG